MEKRCGLRDTWETPVVFRDAVANVFGWPDVDVCGSVENGFRRLGGRVITEAENGLVTPWGNRGELVWCNPPGSQVGLWVLRAAQQVDALGVRALVLVQMGVETDWFCAVKERVLALPLRPRVQFEPPAGVARSSNPRNYMLLVFEPWMAWLPGERVQFWEWPAAARRGRVAA
jgi:phage N-6-adenine-methyltransferase